MLVENAIESRDWSSSLIKHTDYSFERNELKIVFHNNSKYTYLEITPEEYESFCNAESIGSYFGKHIRNKNYTKIENPQHVE